MLDRAIEGMRSSFLILGRKLAAHFGIYDAGPSPELIATCNHYGYESRVEYGHSFDHQWTVSAPVTTHYWVLSDGSLHKRESGGLDKVSLDFPNHLYGL
jgi:hypothetical protein